MGFVHLDTLVGEALFFLREGYGKVKHWVLLRLLSRISASNHLTVAAEGPFFGGGNLRSPMVQVLFRGWNEERGSEILFIVYFTSYNAHVIAQRVSFVRSPFISSSSTGASFILALCVKR